MILSATYTNLPLSGNAPILYRGEIEPCFSAIQKAGFQGVEVHLSSPSSFDATKLRELLKKYGLQLTALGTGLSYNRDRLSLTADTASQRNSAIKRLCEYLELAALFPGCVVIVGLIRGKKADSSSPELYKEHLLHAMNICADYASDCNAELVLELINRYEADFLCRAEEGLAFLKQLNHPAVKLHMDTFHMNIEEADPARSILLAGKQLGHIHLADSDRRYPGHGHFPFQEILAALRRIRYQKALSLELLPLPDAETAALQSIHTLRQLGI